MSARLVISGMLCCGLFAGCSGMPCLENQEPAPWTQAGAPRPDISTAEAFKRALLGATSVAYTDPSTGAASGVFFMSLAEKFGIADEMKAKAKLGSGGPVAE